MSEVHYVIPEDVKEYLCKMGPSATTSKLTALCRKAIQDDDVRSIPEIKGKLISLSRQLGIISSMIVSYENKLHELGLTEHEVTQYHTEISKVLNEEKRV